MSNLTFDRFYQYFIMLILFGLFLAALVCINKPTKSNIGKYQSMDGKLILDTETGKVYYYDPNEQDIRILR